MQICIDTMSAGCRIGKKVYGKRKRMLCASRNCQDQFNICCITWNNRLKFETTITVVIESILFLNREKKLSITPFKKIKQLLRFHFYIRMLEHFVKIVQLLFGEYDLNRLTGRCDHDAFCMLIDNRKMRFFFPANKIVESAVVGPVQRQHRTAKANTEMVALGAFDHVPIIIEIPAFEIAHAVPFSMQI